jgi:uncharacterized protein YodC (DUF2158 family)
MNFVFIEDFESPGMFECKRFSRKGYGMDCLEAIDPASLVYSEFLADLNTRLG